MIFNPKHLDLALKNQIKMFKWTQSKFLDLHALGIHYFDPSFLPTELDEGTYASLYHRGITPPNALPIYIPPDCNVRIEEFLETQYYKLRYGGVGYLGNEFNIQSGKVFDKAKVKICLCKLSPYRVMEGAFGVYLIANFINDYASDEEIFIDFAYQPEDKDIPLFYEAGLPFLWGLSSKRPLTEFDIIIFGTSYAGERVNLPLALVKSGIPLHRWERFDTSLPYHKHCPDVLLAGIGASCFHPKTKVLMLDGEHKLIGDISIGEYVQSWNFGIRRSEPKMVTNVIASVSSKPLLEIVFEDDMGNEVRCPPCTFDHPFYTNNRGWVIARELTLEDDIKI